MRNIRKAIIELAPNGYIWECRDGARIIAAGYAANYAEALRRVIGFGFTL